MHRILPFLLVLVFLVSASSALADDPGYRGFRPLRYYPCSSTTNPEFHPLRPYPGSPCDPYILQKVPEATANLPRKEFTTYSCNNSLNTSGTFQVYDYVCDNISSFPGDCATSGLNIVPANLATAASNPGNMSYYYDCGGSVCLVHQTYIDFNVDLSITRIPIIADSEFPMGDQLLTNTYLDWYLNGTIQHAEWNRQRMNPSNPVSRNRIVTYSGPLLKQLPRSFANEIRTSLRSRVGSQIHNYRVGSALFNNRITSTPTERYFLIPLTTQEDTTSEITVGLPMPQPNPGNGEIITSCRDIRGFEIALGRDPSDSRIYIPAVRSDDALSETLASLSRPYPTGIVRSDDSVLFSRTITQHQGLNDGVPVQRADYLTNSNTRNTEINTSPLSPASAVAFPNRYRAPEPITPLAPNPECEQPYALTDAGASTLGSSKYNSTLIYYQHFQYTPAHRGPCTNCSVEGGSCWDNSDCCYDGGSCDDVQENDECSNPAYSFSQYYCELYGYDWSGSHAGHCSNWPRRTLSSLSRVGVYTKTPLVERIYDTLVVGRQSILRRFAPIRPTTWPTPEYIRGELNIENTIPGAGVTRYTGTTQSLTTFQVSGGNGYLPVDIYYDRIGSLSDHFLGDPTREKVNLQKLLRPLAPTPIDP